MSECAGCCDIEDCPCAKVCDETYCERHLKEKDKEMQAYFGLRPGMSRAERQNQLEAMNPNAPSEADWAFWRSLK